MSEFNQIYKYSYKDSINYGEETEWRESYKDNCDCAKAIEKAINENYYDNILHDCAKEIIDYFGYDRVNWVLANTVDLNDQDGRFSKENKEFATKYYFPDEDYRRDYTVDSHPGLTNLFINQVNRECESLNLFDKSHCTSEEKLGIEQLADEEIEDCLSMGGLKIES